MPFKVGKLIKDNLKNIENPKISILGLTFKENCPDIRNSKVFDIIKELKVDPKIELNFHDPIADKSAIKSLHDIELVNFSQLPVSNVLVFAVSHKEFFDLSAKEIIGKIKPNGTIYDIKSIFRNNAEIQKSGLNIWTL